MQYATFINFKVFVQQILSTPTENAAESQQIIFLFPKFIEKRNFIHYPQYATYEKIKI